MRLLYEKLLEKKMNSFRITNPNIICGRIANPPERGYGFCFNNSILYVIILLSLQYYSLL